MASGQDLPAPVVDLEANDLQPSSSNLAEDAASLAGADVRKRVETLTDSLSHYNLADGQLNLDSDEFDLQQILRRVIQKEDDQGIKLRSIGIMFKNLTARGIDQSASFAPSLAEVARNIVSWPWKIVFRDHLLTRNIIEDFNGLVKQGEMLLVLGRPGSGCTSLLKCCAGEVDQFKAVSGEISYDGLDQKTVMRYFNGDIIYNAELDVHFPTLTVDQTLSFAVKIRAPRTRVDNITRQKYITSVRDVIATVFGLRHAYNTKVGNDYVRGVSGGERKRVSLAEVMAARPVMVSWDNATRGLDSSTALEYAQTIRTSTSLLQNVALVTIYQAGEHIYKLFDKVTVIYAGRQVYFGPIDKAKQYFVNMGWECPARQTTSEFLTAVTDAGGRTPRSGYENKVPRNAEEFVKYWKASPEFAQLLDDIATYKQSVDPASTLRAMKESANQEKMRKMPQSSPYTIAYRSQLWACTVRGYQRIWGDMAYMITNFSATVIQSLIIGSLFYNIPVDVTGVFSRGGVIFFSILFNALTSMAEITNAYAQRPIVLKHKSYGFYHPSAEALASLVSDFPIKLLTTLLFDIIIYFLANLNRKAGQFFYFWLFTFLVNFVMKTFFQFLAACTKIVEVANAIAGLGILALSIYAGYVIPRPSMHPWFKWISYINPVAYGFENLMLNEFHGRRLPCGNSLIPQGAPYENVPIDYKVCAVPGASAGHDYVLGDDYVEVSFGYKWHHLWRNFGIIIAFWIFFTALYAFFSEVLRPVSGGGDVLLFKRTKATKALIAKKTNHAKNSDANAAGLEKQITDDRTQTQSIDGIEDAVKSKEVFSWQHVDYVIPVKGGTRKLLDDTQGYVRPGTMTALMGESGAGKTTLLNVLAQRIDFGIITGDMLVNGKPLDASFQRRTGYVQQQDLHLAESSVREALRFAALLRQPNSTPKAEKYAYVETVIKLLGMEEYAEAIIGAPGRGLNVEQRKKLSIGVELASKPNLLLFLDEPTSGLDSQSAWAIVTFLRRLANAGQSILCTIHQPSATLFEQFDRLLLLKKGGKTVYFGEIGKNSETIIDYFERQGAPACAPGENPAEYILNCIGAGATASVKNDWNELWVNSENCAKVTNEIATMQSELASLPRLDASPELTAKFAMPWTTQLAQVTLRTSKHYWRSPSYILSKLTLSILSGLFIGFTFWNLTDSITDVQNGLFAVFMGLITCVAFINMMQPRLINLRELFEVRESASDTYHWSALFLGQLLVEIPYNIVCGTIFFCCYYFPIHFNRNPGHAGYFYFIYIVLYHLFFTTFGLAIGAVSPDSASASIIAALLYSFVLSFCGVLQPQSLMPRFWIFMYRVSPLTYVVQSLLGSIFHERPVVCTEEEFNVFNPFPGMTCGEYAGEFAIQAGGYIDNLNATAACKFCKWRVADVYLESVNVDYTSSHWRNVGLLCAYVAFNTWFLFFGYWLIRVHKWQLPGYIRNFGQYLKEFERPFGGGATSEQISMQSSWVGRTIQSLRDENKKIRKKIDEDAGLHNEEDL
ncbi:ABC-2 type transporter-domain-containing protein [Lipomyces japonicus]|uniref:ABC-2 type transporter-domain-containing protein n=1 Tax=Lipomyces japonicus TaxID=56871 RepID=UPI0034D01D6C